MENINNINNDEKPDIETNTPFAGIPIEPELNEPWRKKRFSCSGSGRIEKNFDFKYLEFLEKPE
jgi:hypothetical protein